MLEPSYLSKILYTWHIPHLLYIKSIICTFPMYHTYITYQILSAISWFQKPFICFQFPLTGAPPAAAAAAKKCHIFSIFWALFSYTLCFLTSALQCNSRTNTMENTFSHFFVCLDILGSFLWYLAFLLLHQCSISSSKNVCSFWHISAWVLLETFLLARILFWKYWMNCLPLQRGKCVIFSVQTSF